MLKEYLSFSVFSFQILRGAAPACSTTIDDWTDGLLDAVASE